MLKDDPHRVSLFIGGDPHAKLCRVMEKKGLSAEEAIEEIRTVDHQRKAYHNYYCEMKWGDARAYDLTVKSDVWHGGYGGDADPLHPSLPGKGLNKEKGSRGNAAASLRPILRLQQQNAGVRAGLEGVVVPKADLAPRRWGGADHQHTKTAPDRCRRPW